MPQKGRIGGEVFEILMSKLNIGAVADAAGLDFYQRLIGIRLGDGHCDNAAGAVLFYGIAFHITGHLGIPSFASMDRYSSIIFTLAVLPMRRAPA